MHRMSVQGQRKTLKSDISCPSNGPGTFGCFICYSKLVLVPTRAALWVDLNTQRNHELTSRNVHNMSRFRHLYQVAESKWKIFIPWSPFGWGNLYLEHPAVLWSWMLASDPHPGSLLGNLKNSTTSSCCSGFQDQANKKKMPIMSDNQFHESLQQLGLEQTVPWQPPPLVWEMFLVGSSLQSSWSPFLGTQKAAIKGVHGWKRLTLQVYIELGFLIS